MLILAIYNTQDWEWPVGSSEVLISRGIVGFLFQLHSFLLHSLVLLGAAFHTLHAAVGIGYALKVLVVSMKELVWTMVSGYYGIISYDQAISYQHWSYSSLLSDSGGGLSCVWWAIRGNTFTIIQLAISVLLLEWEMRIHIYYVLLLQWRLQIQLWSYSKII